jgi:predicted TIM-barrel fold metal-dependent hydrolase
MANERLSQMIQDHRDFFLPLACLDPTAAYWQEDLVRCIHELGMVGARLFPTYHHYFLDDEPVVEFASELCRLDLPVFISLMVEEDRFAHPAVKTLPLSRSEPAALEPESGIGRIHVATRVKESPIPSLMNLLSKAPRTTFVILMAHADQALPVLCQQDLASDRIFFDISRMDKPTLGLDDLVQKAGSKQLVLGTNTPFLYPEGALMNLAYREFSDGSEAIVQDILSRNFSASDILSAAVRKLERIS